MSSSLPETLRECHRLRKHLRELQSEIDHGPRVMKAQQNRLKAEQDAHQFAHDTIQKLKLKIREDEGSLKQANQQLLKYEKQLEDAGSSKEYDAKQHEIQHTKEKINGLEEAILVAMEDLEQRTAALPAVDAQWKLAQQEFEQYKVDASERLTRMQKDQAETQAELSKREEQIPADIRSQYDRLIKRYGPDGLAGLNGRVCQQCHTTVIEQHRVNIQMGQFVCCPNCGRAQYVIG